MQYISRDLAVLISLERVARDRCYVVPHRFAPIDFLRVEKRNMRNSDFHANRHTRVSLLTYTHCELILHYIG